MAVTTGDGRPRWRAVGGAARIGLVVCLGWGAGADVVAGGQTGLVPASRPSVDPVLEHPTYQLVNLLYRAVLWRNADIPASDHHFVMMLDHPGQEGVLAVVEELVTSREFADGTAAVRTPSEILNRLYDVLRIRRPRRANRHALLALAGNYQPIVRDLVRSQDFEVNVLQDDAYLRSLDYERPVNEQAVRCDGLRVHDGAGTDASGVLQACIDNASAPILELPPGLYHMWRQIRIDRPLTITSERMRPEDPPCRWDANHSCAEVRATANFHAAHGIVRIDANGVTLDHLVVDGDKAERQDTADAAACADGSEFGNTWGQGVKFFCDDCGFTNGVSRNALCGSALVFSDGRRQFVTNSAFVHNGIHRDGLWADGVTVQDSSDSVFTNNFFLNNTDVGLVFGGCRDCVIAGNLIVHDDEYLQSSFAALSLYRWLNSSGEYAGSIIADNHVTCGTTTRQCGIGIYIGSDNWHEGFDGPDVHNVVLRYNTVVNAQIGYQINDAHDVLFRDNTVTNAGGKVRTGRCGVRDGGAYLLGTASTGVDSDRTWTIVDWDGCIPNHGPQPE